jgi:TRAP-type C4-dicarboxylate transport system permease small subunit
MLRRPSHTARTAATLIELLVILTGVVSGTLFAHALADRWPAWWRLLTWPVGFALGLLPFLLLAAVLDAMTFLRRRLAKRDIPNPRNEHG